MNQPGAGADGGILATVYRRRNESSKTSHARRFGNEFRPGSNIWKALPSALYDAASLTKRTPSALTRMEPGNASSLTMLRVSGRPSYVSPGIAYAADHH